MKNLKNMALRNRNFIQMGENQVKMQMPVMNCDSLSEQFPGLTKVPGSPSDPSSPRRQQFYDKYILSSENSARNNSNSFTTAAAQNNNNNYVASSNNSTERSQKRVRNMVYANKKERQAEKNACSYIVSKVLN